MSTLFLAVILAIWLLLSIVLLGDNGFAAKREYKSGTTWCFWRWTEVPSDYIRRLHVVKTPWFAICLHWLNKPDQEPWMHDHPVSFLSCILRGGYAEKRQTIHMDSPRLIVHRWFNFVRASEKDSHRIVFVRRNTLTLCFMGPKTREWGFHTDQGWIGWKTYNDRTYASLKASNDILRDVYNDEAVAALARRPSPFFVLKKDIKRYSKYVEPVEFDDEEPTHPRAFGEGKFGEGKYGDDK